eukprot:CAMPEP_0119191610 /NCGR_PEP_ID=MMETSP1316-20130426/2367_1 /TAXON_ID=41880 /ORGANISM="Pycnococcus provasolii, Strain RCC2336" /LENGTH=227 /DNA_ID=CAMNT_0007186663 /DNA_START=123 /DNA_END=808 /DNA_ORIENTATION=+
MTRVLAVCGMDLTSQPDDTTSFPKLLAREIAHPDEQTHILEGRDTHTRKRLAIPDVHRLMCRAHPARGGVRTLVGQKAHTEVDAVGDERADWVRRRQTLEVDGEHGHAAQAVGSAARTKAEYSWYALNSEPVEGDGFRTIAWVADEAAAVAAGTDANARAALVTNKGKVVIRYESPTSCAITLSVSYAAPEALQPMGMALGPVLENILKNDLERFAVYSKKVVKVVE